MRRGQLRHFSDHAVEIGLVEDLHLGAGSLRPDLPRAESDVTARRR